jgi:hypothetical protein
MEHRRIQNRSGCRPLTGSNQSRLSFPGVYTPGLMLTPASQVLDEL